MFCDIVHGTSPVSWVYQDDKVVAFMDVQPITQGHMLVMPREHSVLITDTNEALALHTFRVARWLAWVARRTLNASGVNIFVMDGEAAYQDVPHFHAHVIPRYPKDGFGLTFPTSYENPPTRAQLDAIANALRAAATPAKA